MKNYWQPIMVLLLAFGSSLVLVRYDRDVYQEERGPASACPFSIPAGSIKHDVLVRKTLLSHIETTAADDRSTFNFMVGNFTDENGPVCDVYKAITFEYEGLGVYNSGSPVRMRVSGTCSRVGDGCQVGVVDVPLAKYFAEKPSDIDEKISQANMRITLQNTGDEWPARWILKKIILSDREPASRKIVLEGSDLEGSERHPATMVKTKQLQ